MSKLGEFSDTMEHQPTLKSDTDDQQQQPYSAAEQSFEMKDVSSADASSADLEQSDSSKIDIDTSSSSIVVDNEPIKDYTPRPKKIKLSVTQSKILKAEKEQIKKERDELKAKAQQARLEKEKEKIEKEKERLEALKMKLKQKEEKDKEKEAEKEKKQQEALKKKQQQEQEKQEKLRLKEEERERKEREKKEKETERNQIREAKEREKQRRQEEKQAVEDRKKHQDEQEAKKLQKSRDVLFNFLKKTKSNSDNNANNSFCSESSETFVKDTPGHLLEAFDEFDFEQQIASQSVPPESLYLNQLLSGKIKSYITPLTTDDCEIVEEFPENFNKEKYVFLQFHENIRPAYFGARLNDLRLVTLSGRNPFKKQEFLDYEVDSDQEWEEEGETGESLSGSESEEEKDKDDYQMDYRIFVPHGYLSDDENKVAEGDDPDLDAKSSGPLMKEQALMAERTCKFAKSLCPQVIGCIWEAEKEIFREKFDFLQQFKAVRIAN